MRASFLQFQDAVMRAQFNRTGASNYHLRLHPNILPAVTINVPNNQGFLLQSSRGVVVAAVDYGWWGPQINNLITKAEPTHLAFYLTDDVFNYLGGVKAFVCCVLGYHSVKSVANFFGAQGVGNPPLQTFAWVSWMSPGFRAGPNGGLSWHVQDMMAVSHEIAEWAADPFGQNFVEPWFAPRYGCSPIMEPGDAVIGIGFAKGTNTFRQGPNPDGTQSADGYYHLQDELFLPWFMRLAPNPVSEPTQTPSANIGRYSFMGDLNTFGFNQPPSGCPVN
jgi:hypothetical protein